MKKLLLYTLIAMIVLFACLILENYLQISIYPVIKKIEHTRMINSKKNFNSLNSKNFRILHLNNRKIAKITADILEKHYEDIYKRFNFFPDKKIPVIIYNDEKDLLETIKLKEENSPVGAYYSGIIHILSPEEWIDGDIESIYKKTTPAIHELTHLIIDEKTKNNYPLWLTEGVALYMEKELMGIEWEHGKGKTYDISLKDLNNNFSKLNQEKAYRKSYEVVSSLVDKHGFDKINLLLDDLGKGRRINNSFEAVFKLKIEDYDR